jgi:hypothetical protein
LQFRRIIIFVSFGSVQKGVCFCGDTFFHFFANKKKTKGKKKSNPTTQKSTKKTVWIKKNEAFVVPVFLFEERPRRGNDDRETPPSRKTFSASASSRRSEDTGVGFNVFFRQ